MQQGLYTKSPLFFFQKIIDFLYQFQELLRILLDGGLRAEIHPAFPLLALHMGLLFLSLLV